MIITFGHKNRILEYNGIKIKATCDVRNELNGRRKGIEIVTTKPDGIPYYPRVFPIGLWTVKKPVETKEKFLAPWFIPTTATQLVETWTVKDALYDKKTGKTVTDGGYGIHFSTSETTLGCIRVGTIGDIEMLVDAINKAIEKRELVQLEVVE